MKELKIEAYSISKDGLKGCVKSPVIWGHAENNGIFPLCYIRKPKWMFEEDFNKLLDNLELKFPKGQTFKYGQQS